MNLDELRQTKTEIHNDRKTIKSKKKYEKTIKRTQKAYRRLPMI